MSDYTRIRESVNVRTFLRHNIYDEEALSIFDSLISNGVEVESFVYDKHSNMYVFNNVKCTTPIEQVLLYNGGNPVMNAFMQFISHPVIIQKIDRLDFNLNQDQKAILREARVNIYTASLLVDITEIPNHDKSDLISFTLKL